MGNIVLNKDICKKCWRITVRNYWKWQGEKLWNRGKVFCPNKFSFDYKQGIDIFGSIPDSCPYYMEHLILLEKFTENI